MAFVHLSFALAASFLIHGAPTFPSQHSQIDATTGNTVDRMYIPGDPEALSVVVINNVADVMIKTKDVVGAGGGWQAQAEVCRGEVDARRRWCRTKPKNTLDADFVRTPSCPRGSSTHEHS